MVSLSQGARTASPPSQYHPQRILSNRLPCFFGRRAPVPQKLNNEQSFLFYWLLAPNVTSFRRNRALRGRIAPFPGAEGNSIAIFRARVVGVTEEVCMCLASCLYLVAVGKGIRWRYSHANPFEHSSATA